MIPSLLQAEKSVSGTNQWRMQRSLLQAFPLLAEYLTSDQIYENFVPICFRYMADGVPPVKISAALALAVFLRNNCKIQQRYELAQKVVKEYGQGQSYWSRLLYIDFCESFLRAAELRVLVCSKRASWSWPSMPSRFVCQHHSIPCGFSWK